MTEVTLFRTFAGGWLAEFTMDGKKYKIEGIRSPWGGYRLHDIFYESHQLHELISFIQDGRFLDFPRIRYDQLPV